jgi:V/A-type H+-transporting ATPase subunit E
MNQQSTAPAKTISENVESLIERLKNEGVTAGKQEAAEILAKAQEKSDQILAKAHREAEGLINQAHAEIKQERQAMEDALGLAARNMRLELRQVLYDRFKEEVRRLIHQELTNEETIRQLIMLLTLDNAEALQKFKAKNLKLELPATVLAFEEIRKDPTLLAHDPLKALVQGVTRDMFKRGMEVHVNHNKAEAGIKIGMVDEKIEIDLSEEAISELLLKHIQPRFRALLEGLLQ